MEDSAQAIRMQVLGKSRKQIQVGDIFVLRFAGVGYVWGRVACTTAKCGMGPATYCVVYIFNVVTPELDPIPELYLDKMTLPPYIVARQMWSQFGHFQTVARREPSAGDLLEVHCFETRQRPPGYYNEFDVQLDQRYEPCGRRVLNLPLGINDDVCRMLGVSPTV